MFLSEHDIRRRIQERSLGIEPFDESQLSGFAIDLRLGQQFRELPFVDLDRPEQALTNYTDVGLGHSFAVEPGGSLVGVSIEYVLFPADLAGFLFPRSSLERIGLTVSTGTIDPGFRGKIAVVIRNTTRLPARLYPGQGILRLCFGELSGPVTHASRGSRKPAGAAPSEAVDEEDEIQRLKNSLKGSMSDLQIVKGLSERLTTALEADEAKKGKLLEELMEEIFTGFAGFTVMKRNARLRAEEVDLIVKNNLDNGFWRIAGSPIIVECKNWSGKTGAREISVLLDKLQALSPDAKTGILVSPNGITGNSTRDAGLKIREARQRGRYILIFDRNDLREIVEGASLEGMIEKKYEQLLMI